ncbi:MAG: ATP-binding cassette domain-containing protein [Dehalococcoidia bacterium]|nr:ATP-binding cassette domain-containing protein [Dehalococcoidia bacterium]
MTGPAVRLDGVSVWLGERLALRDVTCEVPAGAFVGLIGPNGSGKSTLLRSVLGILPLAGGSVEVAGRAPSAARDLFAYVPQRSSLELDLPLRAWDIVMMGRIRHNGLFKPAGRVDKEIAGWALERVGLAERRNSSIGEMSFGQQQRVFFARALAQQGSIMLLDEPMNGVDAKTQELFLELLAAFQGEGKTILMATHDLEQAASACDMLCILDQRLVAFGPPSETLTESNLREAYGVHLHLSREDHILEDAHHHETGGQR